VLTGRQPLRSCSQRQGAMGELFELSRNGSTWVYTVLHDFGGSEGARPRSNLIFDRQGNLTVRHRPAATAKDVLAGLWRRL